MRLESVAVWQTGWRHRIRDRSSPLPLGPALTFDLPSYSCWKSLKIASKKNIESEE